MESDYNEVMMSMDTPSEVSPADLSHLASDTAVESHLKGLLRIAKYICKRCGHSWNPRPGCPDPPTCCPYILCHSTYWSRDPIRTFSRHPQDEIWNQRREKYWEERQARREWRRLQRARKTIEGYGMEVRTVRPRLPEPEPLPQNIPPPLARGVTIPPPPGMRDLRDEGDQQR